MSRPFTSLLALPFVLAAACSPLDPSDKDACASGCGTGQSCVEEQYAAQVRAALPAWVPFARVELPGAYNVQTSRSLGVEGVEE